MADAPEIEGFVAEGFGAVADAFRANFVEREELGAAFALYVDGHLRVDIWAGIADRKTGRPWAEDTLQLVLSTTKGAMAICVARLVAAGLLSYGDRVADHWPEFAANGKGEITVAQVLSHQAGVPYVDAALTFEEVMAIDPIVAALAAQAPMWEPGTAHGYHALTSGWLAGELVRRVDGRTLGTYFAEEIVQPLGLEFWIGLPESEEPRVSRLVQAPPPSDPVARAALTKMIGPGTMGFKSLTLDGIVSGAGAQSFNGRAIHATEMPAANGITTARSLARMYAATVGAVDGVRLLDDDTVAMASAEAVNGRDACLGVTSRFGMGFMLDGEMMHLLSPTAFGHPGAGGSLGYADPQSNVGYGYVMNQMRGGVVGDQRNVFLTDAVRTCL